MPKTKTLIPETKEDEPEKFSLIPPEVHYLSTNFIVRLPVNDYHLKNPWELRLYAAQLIEQRLGDDVQLTGLKVKKPTALERSKAKLLKREPQAKLLATIKF